MKKILLSLTALSLFGLFSPQMVYACSPESGVSYPTIDTLLSQKDTAISIVQPRSNGAEVKAKIVIGNENSSPIDLTLVQTGDSCSTRFAEFKDDELILVIYKKNESKILHQDLDSQFSFAFKNSVDVFSKYNEFNEKWKSAKDFLGEGEYAPGSYIPAGRTLRPGETNRDEVISLQRALAAKLGVTDFKLDGVYGSGTTALVKEFQEKNGLGADGIAGIKTQAKLVTLKETSKQVPGELVGSQNNQNLSTENTESNQVPETSYQYVSTGYSLRPGLKDDGDVKKLQAALKEILSLGAEFKIDGSYGPMTQKAVKDFQEQNNLEADSIAGVKTQGRLEELLAGKNIPNSSSSNGEVSVPNELTVPDAESNSDANTDIINAELVKIIIRAKNEIKNYKTALNTYIDAHSAVIKYNNELLAAYSKADPLYKSLDGGTRFVYFAKNADGKYICVDNTENALTTKDVSPTDGGNISC